MLMNNNSKLGNIVRESMLDTLASHCDLVSKHTTEWADKVEHAVAAGDMSKLSISVDDVVCLVYSRP